MKAVSNEILVDPELRRRLESLPEGAREALDGFLRWLYPYARMKAEISWRRSKGPMAVYWKAIAAWSRHLRAAVRKAGGRPIERRSDGKAQGPQR